MMVRFFWLFFIKRNSDSKQDIFDYIKYISKKPIFDEGFSWNNICQYINEKRTSKVYHYANNHPELVFIVNEHVFHCIHLCIQIINTIGKDQNSFNGYGNGIKTCGFCFGCVPNIEQDEKNACVSDYCFGYLFFQI